MSSSLLFSRNTKVFLEKVETGGNSVWEVPVLDGFSFSQAQNSSEVTLNEAIDANGKSKRSRRLFNDSYAPAEWSLSTYIRPFASVPGATDGWQVADGDADVHAVEELLWASLVGKPTFTKASGSTAGGNLVQAAWSKGITNQTNAAGGMVISFADSDIPDLGTFNIYFVTSNDSLNKVYKVTDCCVNDASIDFDIDGIASINWSGFGSEIVDQGATVPTATIKEKVTDTTNYIRNRLTSMTLKTVDNHLDTNNVTTGATEDYQTVLTGGSISFNNNLTFLTPEFLGKINKPIGHVVGARSISGSFTCYLDTGTHTGKRNVADLFKNLIEADTVVTNSFDMDISIGGTSGNRVEVSLPRCHLEVPSHSVEDVIALEVNFHALASSLDPTADTGTAADNMEAKLVYKV